MTEAQLNDLVLVTAHRINPHERTKGSTDALYDPAYLNNHGISLSQEDA